MENSEHKDQGMISVIMPVYNVKDYLERSVRSVAAQTFRNLEIILVDDGSTDGSGELCESLASEDRRIRVIHRENGGAASSRNTGLDEARGGYIAFADADDFLHPQMLERLLKIQEKEDADIVAAGFLRVPEEADPEECFAQETLPEENVYICVEEQDVMKQLFERDILTVVLWNKLFRREVFHGIRFPEGRTFEDFFVMHRLLWNCRRIVYTDDVLYFYAERGESVSRKMSRSKILDSLDGHEDRIVFFRENIPEMAAMAEASMLRNMKWRFSVLAKQRAREDCRWFAKVCAEKLEQLHPEPQDREIILLTTAPDRYYRRLRIKETARRNKG
ncbi:MAG: glycosyltransferase [Lachnospiraceae bacterium]|nr:glycosyltransferase [Lachnospiraceae bacterium]